MNKNVAILVVAVVVVVAAAACVALYYSSDDITYITDDDMDALGFEFVSENAETVTYQNETDGLCMFNRDGTFAYALSADETMEIYEIAREGLLDKAKKTAIGFALSFYKTSEAKHPFYSIYENNDRLVFDNQNEYIIYESPYDDPESIIAAGVHANKTFNELVDSYFNYLIVKESN